MTGTRSRDESLSSRSFAEQQDAAQCITLSQSELDIVELLFHAAGEGEIEIVTTEQKVLAYGGALKLMLAINQTDTDQAEVSRAAADVADQNQIAIAEVFALSRLCVSICAQSTHKTPPAVLRAG